MTVLKNAKGGPITIHATATTTTVIAGNSSVSQVCSTGETLVIGAHVRKAVFSSNGSWTIARGANTVFVCHGTGVLDFAGNSMALTQDKAANVVLTLSASSTGSILVECSKEAR